MERDRGLTGNTKRRRHMEPKVYIPGGVPRVAVHGPSCGLRLTYQMGTQSTQCRRDGGKMRAMSS